MSRDALVFIYRCCRRSLGVGLYELDLGEDSGGGGSPGERCGMGVPVGDVVADLLIRTVTEVKVRVGWIGW